MTWDGVAPSIRAGGSCVERMTKIIQKDEKCIKTNKNHYIQEF